LEELKPAKKVRVQLHLRAEPPKVYLKDIIFTVEALDSDAPILAKLKQGDVVAVKGVLAELGSTDGRIDKGEFSEPKPRPRKQPDDGKSRRKN
jgi:hypothetical protein